MILDYEKIREVYKDTIHTGFYFDSLSAEVGRDKIISGIEDDNISLIFVIAQPGEGKSYMLNLINEKIKDKKLTIFLDNPYFDGLELLKVLYNAKGIKFEGSDFNKLKNELIKVDDGKKLIIFVDEAQLLNDEQFELIRILSDSKIFKFVLAMHKEEGQKILEKKHFKSRANVIVNLKPLDRQEVDRYISSSLLSHGFAEVALMFNKKYTKLIWNLTEGNFRMVKRFLYSLFSLLEYAKKSGMSKHQSINECLLYMSALEIGAIDDK